MTTRLFNPGMRALDAGPPYAFSREFQQWLRGLGADIDAAGLTSIEPVADQFRSQLATLGQILLTSGKAYFVYLGRTVDVLVPTHAQTHVATAGVGAQTAEIGLFSTPEPPNGASQSLTKIVSTSTVDALTTTGIKANTSAFAVPVARDTHLWAGIRTAMATTQPELVAVCGDQSRGYVLETAGASDLTGAGPWTGVVPTLTAGSVSADLVVRA